MTVASVASITLTPKQVEAIAAAIEGHPQAVIEVTNVEGVLAVSTRRETTLVNRHGICLKQNAGAGAPASA